MNSQIDNYLDRPKRYFNIDGVGELGVGLMTLGFGLIQWLQLHSAQDSIWNRMYTLFVFVGVMGAVIHFGTKAIKERITYPRTGYVEYRKDATSRLTAVFLGVTIALLAASVPIYALTKHGSDFSAATALLGLMMAASYAFGFARSVRWKWFVALILALGTMVIAALPVTFVESLSDQSWVNKQYPAGLSGGFLLMVAFFGVTFLVSGGVTFWRYLRCTRPEARETE